MSNLFPFQFVGVVGSTLELLTKVLVADALNSVLLFLYVAVIVLALNVTGVM